MADENKPSIQTNVLDADVKAADEKLKAETAAKKAADDKAKVAAKSTEGLVKMRKGTETLFVHPTTVQAHREAGWEN